MSLPQMTLQQMSLLPYIIDELLEERERQYHPWHKAGLVYGPLKCMFDQNFGLGILDADLENNELVCSRSLAEPSSCGYVRPWRLCPEKQSGVCDISLSKDGFRVNLDVQQFKPDEVSVKIAYNSIVVEGKHEEREDEHGFVSRSFTRRYILPDNIDMATVQSSLSSDGVLQISAEPKTNTDGNERIIPIICSAQPCIGNGGDSADTTPAAQ